LHDAFQASRASERSSVPPFGRVVAGRVGRRRGRLGLVSGLVATGGVIAALLIALRTRANSDTGPVLELARQVMAWKSSTDFLLPAPGLLGSVPRIGEAPAGSPLQALDPGSALGPPVIPRSPRS
jgi:hypothetical protein